MVRHNDMEAERVTERKRDEERRINNGTMRKKEEGR